MIRLLALTLAAAALGASPASGASVSGVLSAAAESATRHPVVCSDDGSGAPASLLVQIADDVPSAAPLVSAQVLKGSAATNTTDPVDADGGASPPVWINGGAGSYEVWVDKTGAGAEAYTLSVQCMTGANGSGVPTGTLVSGAASPLAVALALAADPVRPGDALAVEVTAANPGATAVANVSLALDLPLETAPFAAAFASAGGSCAGSGDGDAICEPAETVAWPLGTLAAGARRSVTVPVRIASGAQAPPNGAAIALAARVLEGATPRASANEAAIVQSAPPFALTLLASRDPAPASSDVAFGIRFGNPTATPRNATLSLTVPAGATFVSATGGGTFVGGVVSWPLGLVGAGEAGERSATLRAAAGAANGTLLRSEARIEEVGVATRNARATDVGAVAALSPLALEIEAHADPAQPGDSLDVQLTAVNVGGAALAPTLELSLPDGVASFDQNFATHGGTCTGAGDGDAICEPGERVRWSLPSLAPGARTSVGLAPQLLTGGSAPPIGSAPALRAELFDAGGGESRWAEAALRIEGAPSLALALDLSPDPIAPGDDVTLRAVFASAIAAGDAQLSLAIPTGATFLQASGGGFVNAGEIVWDLGAIPAGRGGERVATLRVGSGVAAGTPVRFEARLVDLPAPTRTARASAVQVVQPSPALRIALAAGPDPAVAGAPLALGLAIENAGAATLNGLVLETRVPAFTAPFPQSGAAGANCAVSGDGDAQCEPRERVQWVIPTLAPGAIASFPFATDVASGAGAPGAGELIRFTSMAEGPGARATATLRIGAAEDSDADGVSDWLDNCPTVSNPTQSDVGGVGAASVADGIGDACQCGDVSGNGRVTTADATLITRSLLTPPTATLTKPELCNVGGSAACTTADAVIVTRALLVPPAATVLPACAPALP